MASDGMIFIQNFIKIDHVAFYLAKEHGRIDRRTNMALSNVI
jgi:hypothetical protein